MNKRIDIRKDRAVTRYGNYFQLYGKVTIGTHRA